MDTKSNAVEFVIADLKVIFLLCFQNKLMGRYTDSGIHGTSKVKHSTMRLENYTYNIFIKWITLNHISHLYKMTAANRLSDILQCPAGAAPRTCLKTFRQLFIKEQKTFTRNRLLFIAHVWIHWILKTVIWQKSKLWRAPNPLGLSATPWAEHYEFDKTLSKTQ